MARHDVTLREGGSFLRGYFDTSRGIAHIQNLVVSYDYRRQGIGTQLYGQFLAMAKERELSLIFLEVFKFNKVGKLFWNTKGFKVVSETVDEYYECELTLKAAKPVGSRPAQAMSTNCSLTA